MTLRIGISWKFPISPLIQREDGSYYSDYSKEKTEYSSNIICDKLESYDDGSISFKDKLDGILYTTIFFKIDHMTIYGED